MLLLLFMSTCVLIIFCFNRKVTISGAPEAIRSAEAMIMQKVSSNSERWSAFALLELFSWEDPSNLFEVLFNLYFFQKFL